jgi:hypothetical protein
VQVSLNEFLILFLDFGPSSARRRPGCRVMLEPIYLLLVHLSQTL